MKTIMKCIHGSHLYGTNTSNSDLDIKSIFIPSTKDILLQTYNSKGVINRSKKSSKTNKNSSNDIDEDAFSLLKYCEMIKTGDIIALDMLFCPMNFLLETSDEWLLISDNKEKLLSKKIKGYIGYVRAQASKYGIKGSRVACVRDALKLVENYLSVYSSNTKLGEFSSTGIHSFCNSHEFTSIVEIPQPYGTMLQHWEVCNRKMPFTISLKECHNILKKIFDNYGQRALMAETNDGVDWKAMSHAIRAGYQSLELVRTGIITFPRPDAQELLDIKLGKIPYKEVAEKLEHLVLEVESEAKKSDLRDNPDIDFMDHLVYSMYGKEVLREFKGA